MSEGVGRNANGQFAPNNTYAKGNKNADKYKKKYAKALLEYFDKPPNEVVYIKHYYSNGNLKREEPMVLPAKYPTLEGFATLLSVTVRTLENWCERHEEFREAYERAKEIQKNTLIVNSLGGQYNGKFAQFLAMNEFGMSEKSDHKFGGLEGFDLNISIERPGGEEKKP
jgi:hypothetical protein